MKYLVLRLTFGPFAIERRETAKKFFFELIVILDIFQPKNHIWYININFIFLAVSPFSIAKGPFVFSVICEYIDATVLIYSIRCLIFEFYKKIKKYTFHY